MLGDFFIYSMSQFYNHNGKIVSQHENFINPDNRGFRYGDGLFETMVVLKEKIRLGDFHFERLFSGMQKMKFIQPKLFTRSYLENEIFTLCKKNKLSNARIRLAIFRGDGGLYDPIDMHPHFVIQATSVPQHIFSLNENGLIIDMYPHARKQRDDFSNIKSANFLPYVMAALHAKENRLNDCLVLNEAGCIADSTIANIFLLKENRLYTPPLDDGCVAGVMRRFLIENSSAIGYDVFEKSLQITDVDKADEVFLTNATYGLRWVKQFKQNEYGATSVKIIYSRLTELLNNQSS